jgi:hypothetical protein
MVISEEEEKDKYIIGSNSKPCKTKAAWSGSNAATRRIILKRWLASIPNWLLGGKLMASKRWSRPRKGYDLLSGSADEEVAFLRTTKDRIARHLE